MNLLYTSFAILSMISGVELTATCPNKKEKKQNSMFQRHGFDAYFSNKFVPLQRDLPDFRSEWCKSEFGNLEITPPSVSIIICFHNEVIS